VPTFARHALCVSPKGFFWEFGACRLLVCKSPVSNDEASWTIWKFTHKLDLCGCYHGGGRLHCWWMEHVEYSMSVVASSKITLRHVDLTMMWHIKILFVWLTYCFFLINSSIKLGRRGKAWQVSHFIVLKTWAIEVQQLEQKNDKKAWVIVNKYLW